MVAMAVLISTVRCFRAVASGACLLNEVDFLVAAFCARDRAREKGYVLSNPNN